MPLHPALQSLCEQSVEAIGLTTVSAVATTLTDVSVAAELIENPEEAKALHDVLKKCTAILNNGGKNLALRLASLECLYRLSQPNIPAFRTGLLCSTMNALTGGVEDMLTRTEQNATTESLCAAREMFTVLIFRFTNYDTKVCRLLLQHTCDGDVGAVAQTLLRVVVQHRETCEWPLLQATLQTAYELTIPATYYTTDGEAVSATAVGNDKGGPRDATASGFAGPRAAAALDTSLQCFTVESFQAKIVVLMSQLREQRVLEQLLASLRLSWHESTYNRSPPSLAQGYGEVAALGALGRPDVAHSIASVSPEQQMELLSWLSAFSVLCRTIDNMVEFCRDEALAKEMRNRLLSDPGCHDWFAAAAVPAIIAAVQVWVLNVSTSGDSINTNPNAATKVRHSLLTSALSLLRLLRFALYRPTVGYTPALVTAMTYLAEQVRRREPQLRTQYAGMQVMVLTAECFVNMNAATITSPVNLAEANHQMLHTIADDKSRRTLSNSYQGDSSYSQGGGDDTASAMPVKERLTAMTVAEWFALCIREEESPFCEADSGNASIMLLHQCFAAEETALQSAADCVADLVALESQLVMLQNFLLMMTFSELLSELGDIGLGNMMEMGSRPARRPSGAQAAAPGGAGNGETTSKKSKSKKVRSSRHPAAYVCDLTGKLMREPVVLRNGHRFEYDALQNVINQVGHVDPISGEAFDEDIDVNIPLQQEIAAYRVKRATEK